MSEERKMDVKEFRGGGFLMEVNRQFFHPLGLALAVSCDDATDQWSLAWIYDNRDDPEGWVMNEITQPDIDRALKIKELAASKIAARTALSPHIHPESGVQMLTPHQISHE